jgi:hypothetical protein
MIYLLFIILIFSLYMLSRNMRVYKERIRMLDRCNPYSSEYEERHKEYKLFTYNEMLWKIWKSVKSFYKNFK